MMGYLFAALGMVSFGMLGILSKVSDRKKCTPYATSSVLFGASTVLMAVYVAFFKEADFVPPQKIIWIALAFGFFAVTSIWVFLYALQFGKITTSWVIINLSAAVPAVASTLIYQEQLGPRRLSVLALVVVAILLLWKDMREDKGQAGGRPGDSEKNT
jgi:drug/metabolite transporter (DMT)-like permease